MVATMEGPAAEKKYVSDFLASDLPTRCMNYRNTLTLSDSELPNPVKYLTYEPLTWTIGRQLLLWLNQLLKSFVMM